MAYILELSDGTTTIDFLDELGTSPWCHIVDKGMEIGFPKKKQAWTGSNIWRQGRELSANAYENRTITLVFEIAGATFDDILDARGDINRLLEKARENQLSGLSPTVYLKFQIDTTTNPVYFDVLDGDLVVPPELMSIESLTWTKGPSNHKTIKNFELKLTCKPFARGDAVQLVTNDGIFNASEGGGHDNFVSWSGSAVDGDVPGPLRISWKNTNSSPPRMDDVYVGLRDVGTPANWIEVLEAEDYDTVYQGGSINASGDSSGGSEVLWSISGSILDSTLLRWEIPAEGTILDTKGKARAIAIGTFPSTVRFCARSSFELTTLRDFPWKRNSGTVQWLDLGVIDLQPWPVEHDQGAGYWHLDFRVKPDDTDVKNIALDAIYLIPAEDYKYRKWIWKGYHAQLNMIIEDIGRRDQVAWTSGAQKYFLLDWKGLPIHATPGQDGRLFFLWVNDVGNYDPDYAATVNVWHTPYYMDIRGTK